MENPGDLFENPTFLAWLPGETLFSLVSRHHFFWGHTLSAATCKQFFAHRRSGSQHDFPSRLAHFASRTQGNFGDARTLAVKHTLLAYYAAFISPDELEDAIACMSGDSVAHLKLRLGIQTSRFRAHHPLKACEVCMNEDRAGLGWAYWHLDHQFPGVWICQKHGLLLRESHLKSNGVQRFQWHLPSKEHFHELGAEQRDAIVREHSAIQSLSRLVGDMVSKSAGSAVDTGRLHQVYRFELERLGLVTSGGSFRMPEIAGCYLEHVKHLRILPELNALPSTRDEAVVQLGRLLHPPRCGTHPLRHLVLINWLFSSTDAFWCAYGSTSRVAVMDGPRVDHTVANGRDERRDAFVRLLIAEELSLRKAALAIGIDIGTAMAWAADAGLSVSRRPKKLFGEIRRQTIADLQTGVDKAVVAKGANVSVVTITKLLLSEVGLHSQWSEAREARSRELARNAWTQLLKTHGQFGIKLMRAMDPANYAWLYRNDRAWLAEHKPARIEATAAQATSRVDWDSRDATLSAEVACVVLGFHQGGAKRRIKLWQIYQAIPALKAKLARLDRLPLTRRAIETALQYPVGVDREPKLF